MKYRKIIMLLFIACLVFTSQVFGADTKDKIDTKRNDLQSATKQITEAKQEKGSISQKLNWNLEKKKEIEGLLLSVGMERDEVNKELELMESAIQSIDDAICIIEADYKVQRELFMERIRIQYKNSKSSYLVDELVNCNNINEFFTKTKMMTILAEADKKLMSSIEENRLEIEALRQQQQNQIDMVKAKAETVQSKIEEFEEQKFEIEQTIDNNQTDLAYYEKQEKLLLESSRQLEKSLNNLILYGGTYVGGQMTWPVPSSRNISSGYGNRIHPVYGYNRMHTGIDISSRYNNKIVAANRGTVIFTGTMSGYGNVVQINHGGGIVSLYAHINNGGILVANGQFVEKGAVIALIGSTGVSTGPHLHFEVREYGKHVNPTKYVKN